jgi:transposase InsO family protein
MRTASTSLGSAGAFRLNATVPAADHPGHVWALDYQFDQTQDGRRLKLLNIVDEHTRQALAIHVDRRIDADATVAVVDRVVVEHGSAPRFIRCDNGAEFQSRLHWHVLDKGIGHVYIKPHTPRLNGKVERSHRIDAEDFYQLLDGVVIDDTDVFNDKLTSSSNPGPALRFCSRSTAATGLSISVLTECRPNAWQIGKIRVSGDLDGCTLDVYPHELKLAR